MADGNEYNLIQLKEAGQPVEIVYPTEGIAARHRPERPSSRTRPIRTPRGCSRATASRAECQQLIVDFGGLRSMHPQVKEKAGRKPFRDIKTMKDDAAGGREA